MPWKRRTRPVFEGKWGCSKECLQGMVDAAVRREMQGAGSEVAGAHRHRVPLGLMLLAQGLVTEAELKRAVAAQRGSGGGRIGDWLVKHCGVPERDVMRGLGLQWTCPVMGTEGFVASKMALVMPSALRKMCGALPLRVAGGQILYVAFDHEVDAAAAFALERMNGVRAQSCLVSGAAFRAGVLELEEAAGVACREETVRSGRALSEAMVKELRELQPVASRMVRLRDKYWLRMWLERGAIGKEGMLPGSGEDVLDRVYSMGVD